MIGFVATVGAVALGIIVALVVLTAIAGYRWNHRYD